MYNFLTTHVIPTLGIDNSDVSTSSLRGSSASTVDASLPPASVATLTLPSGKVLTNPLARN